MDQGCQIFIGATNQIGKNIPKYRMALKYTTIAIQIPPRRNTPHFSVPMYQSWQFWYENIPSGNPVMDYV
jgi:hypothetical protein